ncbi:MAG: hypothetical protein QOD33_1725 [Pyrinomonadaceae bacterium]|jgi:hypothetical protein|nr:hypothetical protein [Pyrinomonadaceae bacterium]
MRIPVFVSCPTSLTRKQDRSRQMILTELKRMQFEPRALGRSDYPTECPLKEVLVIAKHCSGGVVLGFEQSYAPALTEKRGVPRKEKKSRNVVMPTSWNHLEAGILFGLNLPLLVFKEEGIGGGVFDTGVTDNFVHTMPSEKLDSSQRRALADVFLKWQFRVREHYYR